MKLFLYITRNLFFNLIFLITILSVIMMIIQSIRFIDLLMTRSFSFMTLVTFFSLLIPYILYFILPISTFIAVLYTYQKLHQERELIAMRAAGLSPKRIASPAVFVCILLTCFAYYNSFILLPETSVIFRNMQYDLKEDITATLIKDNQFNELAPDLTIFILQKVTAQEFKGIVIQDNRNPLRKYTYFADIGRFVPIPGGLRITLLRGSQQELSEGAVKQVKFDQLIHEISLDKRGGFRKDTSSMEKNVSFLIDPPPEESYNDAILMKKYVVAGHERISSPLYIVAFTLLCISLLFKGPYQRRGDHRKVAMIALIAFGLQAFAVALKNLSYSFGSMIVLMYLVPIGFIIYSGGNLMRGKNT